MMAAKAGKDGVITSKQFLKMMTMKSMNSAGDDDIKKAFGYFDDDKTGKISFDNLKRVVKEIDEKMTDEDIKQMIRDDDQDGDGMWNEQEFVRVMKRTDNFQ